MERDMLGALRWRTSGPTPQEFACLLLGMLNPEGYDYDLEVVLSMMDVAMHQCELTTVDYELSSNCRPSEVALGAVLNGFEGLDGDSLSERERQAFLNRLCNVLGGVDMSRVKYAKSKLRTLHRENSGLDRYRAALPYARCYGDYPAINKRRDPRMSECQKNCAS